MEWENDLYPYIGKAYELYIIHILGLFENVFPLNYECVWQRWRDYLLDVYISIEFLNTIACTEIEGMEFDRNNFRFDDGKVYK